MALQKISEIEKNKLIKSLDNIFRMDQKYRQEYQSMYDEYGSNSIEMKKFLEEARKSDAENLTKVKAILDKYGWLGQDIVGLQGNKTLFLVIQHSDIDTQIKYFPMMKVAVDRKDAESCDLALLEDRIALRLGKKQIYGTQLFYDEGKNEYYVAPMIEPMNVDERRKKVGLNSINDYISFWGLIWDYKEGKSRVKQKKIY